MSTATPAGKACPRCRAPMSPVVLSSHMGRPVTVDHCRPCRQVWFDTLESVQLDGLGWVKLLRELQASAEVPASAAATLAGSTALPCPACRRPLATVANRSRFGRFVMLECPQRDGHLQSHAGLLAERGLVRPLLGRELKALREERHRITCFNCGAPADGHSDQCAYCGTTLVVLDLPRLASSLKPRVIEQDGAPATPGRLVAWPCRGCGATLDPSRDAACPRCGHAVVAIELPDVAGLLTAAEDELLAVAAEQARRRRGLPPPVAASPPTAAEQAEDDEALLRAGASWPIAERLYGPMLGGWTPLWAALVLALLLAWLS